MKNHKNMKPEQLTAVITGAYGGIGAELCRNLANQGASLILVGRDETKLINLCRRHEAIAKQGQEISYFQADLQSKEEIKELIDHINEKPYPINCLVNNAGTNHFGLFENTSDNDLEGLINTNVLAPMRLTKALLPQLKRQEQARIVNVGSFFGALGYPGFSAYTSTKFALKGFSESLGRELQDTSVSVGHFMARTTATSLNSSAVNAMNTELGTAVDSAEDVAEKLAAFVCSHSSNYTVGWQERLFVQLNNIAPKLITRSIGKQLPVIKRFAAA